MASLNVVVLVVLGGALCGCAATGKQTIPRLDYRRELVAPRPRDAEMLELSLQEGSGMLLGAVRYAAGCARLTEELWTDEVWETRQKPNYRAAALLSGLVSISALTSTALLHNRHSFSDERKYNSWTQKTESSDRDVATGVAIVGIVTAAAATAGTTWYLTQPTSRTLISARERKTTYASKEPAPCTPNTLTGFEIAIEQAGNVIVSVSTRANGDFALVLPDTLRGKFSLVIRKVPNGSTTVNTEIPLATCSVAEPATPIPLEEEAGRVHCLPLHPAR